MDRGRRPAGGLADLATRRDAEALACAARRDRSAELDRRLERRFDHIDDLFDRQTTEIIAAIRSELAAAAAVQPWQTLCAVISVLLSVAALLAVVIGLG
ncbi:MAG: hypothetical protein ACR2K2_12515 [Mycobacteriales bacterium]